ncbi:EAL domain-containing protein, partial [Mesorhizobium sp. M4B.F.Ca.ET.019.03.1.1]|uniref:putative bifunctional diguanylate cyclase/phosphodiesterase n=1 Tax=Mesorhizobium sp. M4B.F.Ca.ET.019.03.1.1 TaxID=2496651 RepID=UPI000FCA534B
ASGLPDPAIDIDVALTGKDALGGSGERFFGGDNVVAGNPVTAEVEVPSGSWRISAIPKGGWPAAPKNERTLLALMALAGVLVVLPILVAGRLFGERQKNYAELRRLSGRLELALEASGIGVWEHDLATNELVWDERVNEIYGKAAGSEPRGYDDWAGTIHPDDIERARRDFDLAAATRGLYSSQYRLIHHDGDVRHVRTRATFFQDTGGTPKMIGAEWDVTSDVLLNENLERERQLSESKNAELEIAKARIEHVALHDSLTGLPNRRYLDEMLVESGESGRRTALLHLDLDRFKQINDTLGHAAGDAMLMHASKVIKANAGTADFVARIGGDEFVVVAHGDGDDKLAELASRIIEEMRQPVTYQGHQCRFGVSIGIAANDGVDARQLLVNADLALYRAKSHGRNRYEFFNEELQSEIVRTKQIADEILGGLERNEFVAYYQPQFDARTLEIVGVEALSRWKHPRRGILAPAAYLKVAEELNVVALIDRTTLKQALENFERWSHLNIPRVSVNVSARRLEDRDLIKGLRKLAIKQGTVSFELVESIFLDENDDFVSWNIEQIKELGIDIEIDDFGTGYASIVSLLKLQPRRLKIDRQLITPITGSKAQRRLVSSIIEIGKSLGIEVVAEGVETMEHARILKELGCDILQGYAFGRPMDAKTFKAFAQSRKWLAVG